MPARPRALAAVGLAVVLGLVAVTGPAAPRPAGDPGGAGAAMPDPPGPLVWADEFDGPVDAPPDPARWRRETGGSGWGNDELQEYTDSPANAALDGAGHLVITARQESTGATCWYGPCAWTSARLVTADRFSQERGRFEARLRVPRGQGLWPAFWMLGDRIFTDEPWPLSGEIDVMENVGYEPGTVWGSLHGPGYQGADAVNASYTLPDGAAFADAFHTFTVDWDADAITWYVDGVAYARRTPADVPDGAWVFDDPFFLLLNVAVGGGWPGAPDGTTRFPQEMVVDHVRVWAPAG